MAPTMLDDRPSVIREDDAPKRQPPSNPNPMVAGQRNARRVMVAVAAGCLLVASGPALEQLLVKGGRSFIDRPAGVGASDSPTPAAGGTRVPAPSSAVPPATGGTPGTPTPLTPSRPRARVGGSSPTPAPKSPQPQIPAAGAGPRPADRHHPRPAADRGARAGGRRHHRHGGR